MGFWEYISSEHISDVKIAVNDLVSTNQYPGSHHAWFKSHLFAVSKEEFSGHSQP